MHGGAAPLQEPDHPTAGGQRDLGEDAVARVDQVEVQLVEGDAGVVPHERPREAQHLCKALDAGEATSDEGDAQPASPLRAGRQAGGLVERGEQRVADRDRLLDALQADRQVGHAGHLEDPRDRARGDDHLVVPERGDWCHRQGGRAPRARRG